MFIKLTIDHNKRKLYLNADKIESLIARKESGTIIKPVGSQSGYNVYEVKETPDQIIKMIGEMKK